MGYYHPINPPMLTTARTTKGCRWQAPKIQNFIQQKRWKDSLDRLSQTLPCIVSLLTWYRKTQRILLDILAGIGRAAPHASYQKHCRRKQSQKCDNSLGQSILSCSATSNATLLCLFRIAIEARIA